MGWIYQIKNIINDKVYIGQTTQHNVATRWGEHIKSINSDVDSYLIRAFKLHGIENFVFSVLSEIPNDQLDNAEIDAISNKNSLSPNGYNIREGGSRGKHSQESIDKIRESHIGKKHTDETKEKLRQLNIGKKHTPESIEKTRRAMSGKPKTREAVEKSARARTGLRRSVEVKEKMSLARRVEVEQWSIEGNYIKTYKSIKQASIETGCNDISKCCRGKYKQSGGFLWKYKDENLSKLNAQSCDTKSSP
jgi:group I intron endonuclease